MKTIAAMVLILACIAFVSPCTAGDAKQEESVGQKIGQTARQVVDESKKAFHDIKEAGKETGKEIYEGAKKGVQKAKETGKETAKEVKSGFNKGDSTNETPKESKNP